MGLTLLRRRQGFAYPGRSSAKRLVRYQMRQQAAVQGGDFWIEDQFRRHVYRIDGTRSGSRDFMDLESAHGEPLCRIRPRATPPWAVEIERPDGGSLAVVPEVRPSSPHQSWTIGDAEGTASFALTGSVADHEYTVQRGTHPVAVVSRRWFKVPNVYGVQMALGEDPALVLALSVALDLATIRFGPPARPLVNGKRQR